MDVVSFVDLCFYCLYFFCQIKKKKILAKTIVKEFTSFSSKFMSSRSYIQVFIHFELIFADGVRW